MYRGTGVSRGVRRTNWERSLKNWELKFSCLKICWVERTFWDSSLLVSLTLWDTPALSTPPLPLPQFFDFQKEVPNRHNQRATTLREAPQGNLPLRRVLRDLCTDLEGSAGFCGGPWDFLRVVTLPLYPKLLPN